MQRLHLTITCGLALAAAVLGVLLWQERSAGQHAAPLEAADPAADPGSLDGLWEGAWDGGQRDGVVFQPVIAELLIRGDHMELAGFPDKGRLEGTVRFDAATRQMHVTPQATPGSAPPPESIDFACELKGGELTLTDGTTAIALKKVVVASRPLVNAEVELVAATGINEAGDLLVTRFSELRAGQVGDAYYRPTKLPLNTAKATVYQAQAAELKKVTLDEARRLIQAPTLVVVACRHIRMSAHQSHELWTEMGLPTPDGQAARQTFARVVRPGTLVFVLSGRENVVAP